MLKGRFERLLLKWSSWGVLGVLSLLVLFMLGAVWDIRGKQKLAWQERENARIAYEEVVLRERALSVQVENFETERGLEEEFRKRFPVAKEGEEVIVLVDAPAPEVAPKPESRGVWGVLQGWFGIKRD